MKALMGGAARYSAKGGVVGGRREGRKSHMMLSAAAMRQGVWATRYSRGVAVAAVGCSPSSVRRLGEFVE